MSVLGITSDVTASLWEAALETLRSELSKPVFEMWIRPLRIVSLDYNDVVLAAKNGFTCDWVQRHYQELISDVLSQAWGRPLRSTIVVADAPSGTMPATIDSAATDVGVNRDDRPRLNERYTFDDFVIGGSNSFAHAAAMAVANAPGRAYNPLFLYGGVGLGKTHLVHAIAHRVLADRPDAQVRYVTSETFTNEFIAAVKENRTAAFRDRYRDVDVLVVDDIQFIAGREAVQEEFYHTFNALHEAGRQVIVCSDRPPKEIQTLEMRLRSRFEGGLIADIGSPDVETREAILRKKAESSQIPAPDDVIAFIARIVTSNVRELEGALIRVVAYAALMKASITIDLAAEVLKATVMVAGQRRVSVAKIKEFVAGAHGLTVREMDNGRRDQRLAAPRQLAMYITTELTNYSLPQIAREFGKKDHTTIMYARDKIKVQIARDEAYRGKVRQLIALIQAA